jgi:membrane dipeptidase
VSGGGLGAFGVEVVRKMEDLGMIIDVSHLSEDGFWDVIKLTKKDTPIFATHSNCKAICDHPRNLTDEQIRIIIERNGFIGLNLYPDFLGGDDLELVIKHAAHIIGLSGEHALGFGFDFDGVDKLPKGIAGIENAPLIIEKLRKHFDDDLVRKMCGGNLVSKIKNL